MKLFSHKNLVRICIGMLVLILVVFVCVKSNGFRFNDQYRLIEGHENYNEETLSQLSKHLIDIGERISDIATKLPSEEKNKDQNKKRDPNKKGNFDHSNRHLGFSNNKHDKKDAFSNFY